MIEDADEVLLSVVSIWEAEIKRAAGRLPVAPLRDLARLAQVGILDVTAAHAEAAAHLPLLHRDPFDRMLVAQTGLEHAVLVSKDRVLRDYGVPVAW